MSCTGNPWLKTPAMDSLAARGTRFTKAYAGVPVCLPSRFCMHTGRLSSEINVRDNRAGQPHHKPTDHMLSNGIGHLLRRVGYRTLYGGKQHFPQFTAEDIGFDVMTHDDRDELADIASQRLSEPATDQPFAMFVHLMNPHDICYMAIRDAKNASNEQGIMMRARIELEELDAALQRPDGVSDEAFFATHCPPLPDNFAPQTDEPQAFEVLLNERPFRRQARESWSEQRWREHRWAYMRLTERVDGQIAKILNALETSEHAANTIVIFTSDHGDMDASHRFEHKTLFNQEAANIPFIIAGLGIPKGQVNEEHVISNALDLVPTLCDFAGVDIPSDLTGSSLRLLWQDQGAKWRPYSPMLNQIGYAIVSRTHKYCRFDHGENAEQLYDLIQDPGEMRNAASDPEQADALTQHRQWFDEYWATRMVQVF